MAEERQGLPVPHEGMSREEKGRLLMDYHTQGEDLLRYDEVKDQLVPLDFEGAVVVDADLSGAKFLNANFMQADFWNVDLSDADLRGCSLVGAQIIGGSLRGTDLTYAVLQGTTIEKVSLDQAILYRAEVDLMTYQLSGWSPEQLRKVHDGGARIVNLTEFPADAIHAVLGTQASATGLDALRVQLDRMELRLPTEAANQLLDDEARARQQLELVASWDLTDDPEIALARLLLSLFPDGEGLKRLVSRQVSTTALAPLLPGGTASPAQIAWAAARAMGKAGAVEGVLEGLKAEVPGRAKDIEGVLEKWRER